MGWEKDMTIRPARLGPAASAPAAVVAQCRVMLDDIAVMADIGVLEAEIGNAQPLFVHVALDVAAPGSDDLAETFDYRAIHAAAQGLGRERIALIETFALRLADHCLADPRVLAAEVRVDKPRAIPGAMARTTLRLARSG